MKIRTGDKVKMLNGKNKGKTGKVLQVLPSSNQVSVEGLNLLVKYVKSKKTGDKGQKIQFPAAVNLSRVALICPICGEATRVGFKLIDKNADTNKDEVKQKTNQEKKFRFCKKCGKTI